MSRFLLVLGLALGLVALLAAAVAALAYGPDAARDGSLEVEGVRQPVALSWDARGVPTIEAATQADLALGLGYAHAADHAWSMTLWRQAGSGALGAWFGPEMRPLDRHARALGFDALARRTYRQLDDSTRALLDAYAAGVNAALRQPGVAQDDAFVLMDVEPGDWRPWDALTVERLLAYLATPAPAADTSWTGAARRDSSLLPFLRADSTFRTTLGIGGTDGARAYVAPARDGRAFVAHQPAGASALDLLAPVTLRLSGRTVAAATVPGTLSAPIGWTGDRGWAVFLTSSMQLAPFTGEPPPPVHSRIVERDGDEVLVEIPRDSSGLVLTLRVPPPALAADSTRPDSTRLPSGWRLRWQGFRTGTDAGAFQRLVAGGSPGGFTLLSGDGLQVGPGGGVPLGAPPSTALTGGLAFGGASSAARLALPVLSGLAADSVDGGTAAQTLAEADISAWAAQTLRPMLGALGDRDSLARALETPYAFLKGWNHRYDPEAIAPSIFETWLESHEAYTGHAPDLSDSLDVLLLPYTLRIAQATLRDRYGPELTSWRWGRLQGGMTRPVEASGPAFAHRFPTVGMGAGGHPTTPYPGPLAADSTTAGTGIGPATWSAWATLGRPRLVVRGPTARIASSTAAPRAVPVFVLGVPASAERPRLTLSPPS